MALQKTMNLPLTYTLSTGGMTGVDYSISKDLTVELAYIKISDVYNVRSTSSTISVNIYKSDKTTLISTRMYTGFIPENKDDSVNIIKQAYRWLITQNEFSDATNVLETGQTA